ncbi:ESPR-type extended signal peptide-containing protein, partial [uncultured Veillonella sp.]|uniref:ESPR-type extended signal peptide-containing protein n=1 Tax=uncultured Veillonella sp. TaxID=159268 RepID=UPI0028D7B6F3
MNKIFKVIWSKSKQCYVVVSEMAKNKTGKKKIVVASILAALAMQVGVVADVTAADRPTGTIEGGTKMYSNLTNGLAIGNESQSNSHQSIAIGYRAIANSQYADPAQPAVAIGAGAHATGRGGVSLGLIANSSVRGTAIGSATNATGFGAFAGGTYAQATNAGDVAIGGASSDQFNNYAVASGGYSVAIGTAAKADGSAGVSIGYKTNAKTSNSLAVGSESQATGEGAVAVGRKNTSTGASSTVLGILSTANATSATAVGMETTAKGENSLAVGHKSSAAGRNGVAVGTNGTTAELGGVAVGQAAKSNKFNSVAMGMNVTADGDNSVALGGSASANSDGTIAIGSYGSTPTKATGNKALAIGSATTANGLESIAIGSRVNSTSQYSIAIGTRANASAVKSVAIGPDSIATVDGGVALGRDSVANVIGGVTNKGYNPNTNRTDIYSGLTGNVLTSTTGAVSIGNGTTVTRQLTGLAAGTKDTDAVNVAQLKSVNLAFSGNVNTGNVNIANSTLGIKGDNTYITTAANGQNLTISGKTQNINVTNGQASANAAGMADSKNVADAINKAISANAYHWKLAADRDPSAPEVINKSDTVIFGGDNNITVTRSGKKITTSLNKAITVDTVKANRSVTVSSGSNQITLDGTNGSVKGRNFTGDSFKAGDNVLSNTTLQIGPTTGSNNVTITRDGLTAKTATKTVKFGTDGISAGGQQITNVSSGGNVGTNAANITDVKNAVDAVTLKLDTNSKTGTVKLSESPLKVIGANGIRTDLVGTNNGSLVVGLDNNTVNATTKGIGLTGDTGSTGLKYLKDGDATFKVSGDGNLVTTKASATGVQVAVDSGKVKDLAVGAVTVSKANTADNPITITTTAGTNTKDYAIGIDTTKLANQTQLTYKANGTNANKVFLANGLNFTDGTFTKATVGTNGNVTISTATETITNDADGKAKVNSPTDGLATAKNVADSINKAVDGLSQNLTVSDGTTDGTVNLKNQKLTVSGTNGVTTTVNGQTVTVGLDVATKTKVDNASTAVARNISLGADSGTASSQSLKDGDVAFNVKAATGDLVSTKMNGNTVEISTKRAAITSDANTGAASVTGDDGLATSKNVADAINKAADAAKAGAAWNLTTNSSTTDKTSVQGGDTVDLINGDNILITQDGTDKKKITVATKKDLAVDSITAGNTVMNTSGLTNGTTAITGTGITTDKVTVGGISIDKTDGINGGNKTITNVASGGTTDTNAANIGDVKQAVANLSQNLNITDGTNNGTIDLKNQKLNVAGANGVTATVNNQTITVGLDTDTKTKVDNSSNAVARNISLGADSGTASSQSLKDGDVAFNVKGATGDFISTKMNGDTVEVSTKRATINSDAAGTASVTGDDGLATAKNVADAINKAASQAKDGAAWKLSANGNTPTTVAGGDTVDFTGGNNITVTQTGKNIATTLNKDLKKLNSISLENGVGETIKFDAINASGKFGDPAVGNYTQIDRDGIRINNGIDVNQPNTANTYLDVGSLSLQAGPNSSSLDSRNLMFNDEDGNFAQGSAQGMAFQSAAGKMVQFSLDEINAGGNKIQEVAEGTADTDAVNVKQLKDTVAAQDLTYRANTAADTDAKTVKLSKGLDFVDGTMTKATVDNDGKVTFDINDDTKAKINDSAAAVNRKVSLGADSGTVSSQSLKDGDVAFNVKGATGDFVSTKMNGNTVEVSTKRATIDSNATTGAASVTGDDGLATAKNVADAINKAAKASTDAINLKFAGDTNTSAGVVNLKDDTLGIKGDGKYVTTDADGKNLTVKVSEAEVKKSAVSAVTVSTDTTDADNPLTVTGTPSADGTTKDYKVTIDGTKVATKTKLSYKANDGTAKQVSLADGLNFKDGTLTTATIDNAGVVKYDVKTAAITAGTDGTITGPATDGVATAKNVADAINAAKKASKTEITANDDEAANATTGNVKLTSTTAADGHTVYNVKLNDRLTFGTGANAIVIDGTAGKATIGSAAIDGVNNTITTGGNKAVTLDGTTGTITGKAANIGGVTVDGTNNHVTGLANTTWDGNAVSGRAATEDQLKVVADAAANQTWQITADKDAATSGKQTGTKSDAKVGKDAKVTMIAGENITINQNERDFTYSLNKDLVNMNSASFNGTGNNTTVINGDSITQTAGTQTNTSTAAGNTVADGTKSTATTADGTKITDGTKTNTSTADSTVIDDGNGNNTALTKDGVTITTAGKDNVSLTGNGLDNGNNKIVNVADGTNDTDAVNVRQLEAKTKASTTE